MDSSTTADRIGQQADGRADREFPSGRAEAPPLPSGRRWPLLLAILLGSLAIGTAAALAYRISLDELAQKAARQVEAIARLKARGVMTWMEERRQDAELLGRSPLLVRFLAGHAGTAPPPGVEALAQALEAVREVRHFRGLRVVSPTGATLLAVGGRFEDSADTRAAFHDAFATRRTALINLHRQADGSIHFGYAAPVAVPGGTGVAGLLQLDFDPETFLFPYLREWPLPTRTGEALLWHYTAMDRVLLNRPTSATTDAFGQRLPLNERGQASTTHAMVLPDYRGVRALGARAEISGTPWSVAAKLDTAEAFAGIGTLVGVTVLMAATVWAALLGGVAVLWQRQRLAVAMAEIRRGEALVAAEARFRATFEQAAVGMANLGPDGAWLRVNGKLCAILGRGQAELAGGRIQDVTHPDDLRACEGCMRAIAAGARDGCSLPLRYLRPDGGIVVADVTISPLRGSGGAPASFVFVIVDVTARRQMEAALSESRASLAELNRRLEERVLQEVAAREAAQERARHAQHMQALGQVAGGVAHEFNNILQAVSGALALILRHPADTARVRHWADLTETATRRGSIVTSRLLAFARRAPFRVERIEVAPMLRGLGEILAHTLGGRVKVRIEAAPDLPALATDRAELETALVNLATNGRDAMAEGGTLTIAAIGVEAGAEPPEAAATPPRSGRFIRISVSDEGSGMDAATLAQATEPFFTTKPPGQGSGLGLSMAKGFAEQNGGALTLRSAPGEGSTVALWLPAAEAVAEARLAGAGAAPGPAVPVRPGRILLVDDEAMLRDTLAAGLADSGFSVLTACGGPEALALLDQGEAVDALITDFSMPAMDGATLARQARALRPGLRTVILTGHIDIDAAAVETVLRKPARVEEIVAALGP
ncbi:Histidine kinase [Rhodovastum atsumiense]|uniref:histidine kinase n=1 Tax=Rhodovastum atsumiense TaxID=504468 RepID=A0A5M6IJE5_9PROT|nr:PAS domain-containing sensor histidine kinase [Rhodovastum atsumiense]KAA5608282.1 PAS domain S-box protein [Rhodovastum atsumiense]CAH2602582.1 Histidine kinase [Rhodovastum atsumiense]